MGFYNTAHVCDDIISAVFQYQKNHRYYKWVTIYFLNVVRHIFKGGGGFAKSTYRGETTSHRVVGSVHLELFSLSSRGVFYLERCEFRSLSTLRYWTCRRKWIAKRALHARGAREGWRRNKNSSRGRVERVHLPPSDISFSDSLTSGEFSFRAYIVA